MAEFAIAQMLMLARDMPRGIDAFREKRLGVPLGRSLWKSTVVILGYGGIGQEIARRLAGFGVRIIAISRRGPGRGTANDSSVFVDRHVAQDEMLDVIGEGDYVVVAAPASAENLGLVNGQVFAHMKRGAFILNIARGPVIDYESIVAALESGQVGGAALDVFWSEPFDPNDRLLEHNVIATPHIAGVTDTSFAGIGAAVAANIERIREGAKPKNCANPEVLS